MENLSIDILSRSVEGGGINQQSASENRVERELQNNPDLANELKVSPGDAKDGLSFSDQLRQALDTVNQDQVHADRSVKDLIAGRTKNIHETMLAIEKADVSLKLAMKIRNKVLDAYREIMRMQV